MKEKKVSIIIPVYNSEKYIIDCIESIQKQTYKNIEAILVDDGSTDSSAMLINEYTSKNSNIRYIWQKNSGAPTARNLGINESNGDYIMFLDSDDILEKDAIKTMVSELEGKQAQLVVGNYEEINEQQTKIRDVLEHETIIEYNNEDIFKCAVFVPYPGNKLYSSRLIKENNIKFANVKIGQDLNFYIKYIAYCKKIIAIPNIISKYRLVEGGISRSYTLKVLDIVKSIENIKQEYDKLQLTDIYRKYISIVELVNYNAQLRKTVYYEKKIDRKIITLFMERYALQIDMNDSTYYGKYKKVVIKFWLKIKLSFIYNSNFISKIYRNKLKKL